MTLVREATLSDRSHFCSIYMEFLKDQHEGGSHLLPTLHNLFLFRELFESYVSGSLYGLCIFWWPQEDDSPSGVVLAGEDQFPSDWDTDLGKTANLWGVYVQPTHRGQGITMKLFQRSLEIGRDMGIETIRTYVKAGNIHGERVALAAGTSSHMEEHYLSMSTAMTSPEALEGLAKEIPNG